MDETGVFFKALPDRGLAEKKKKAKGGNKSKQRMTAAFFVSADGGKVCDPIVIWKAKQPRCFKRLPAGKRTPTGVQYFSDPKSWMQTHIMEAVLTKLDKQMNQEGRNVVLFLDNATVHPTTLGDDLTNIKIRFLPKNTTSKLQMLDAGIINGFKAKYRKKLIRYVVSRIDNGKTASDIIAEVDVLRAIQWVKQAWSEVTEIT